MSGNFLSSGLSRSQTFILAIVVVVGSKFKNGVSKNWKEMDP